MRTPYRVLGGLLVLGVLAYGAVRLRPLVALTSAPLLDLMDACAEAAALKSRGPITRHLLVPESGGYWVARVKTDVGPVTLYLQYRSDTGAVHACGIRGGDWAEKPVTRTPDVTWDAARPKVAEWFGRRLQQPGNVALSLDGSFFAAYCAGDGRDGILLTAHPSGGAPGKKTPPGVAPALVVSFSHVTNNPGSPCQAVAQSG
ncbi:MAG: hypothetical protein ACT4OK_20325 [Gemmobacter sp.]